MADNLTDAQKAIDDVLAVYQDRDLGDPDTREFFAVEIDKALGGLTTEESFGTTYPNYPVRGVRYTRVVGGWTPEEAT